MTATAVPKPRSVREYSVFQTPSQLAEQTVRAIADVGSVPPSVFEPTYGRGAFIHAALRPFLSFERIIGAEIGRAILGDLTDRLDSWTLGLMINARNHNYEYAPPP